MYVGVTFPQTEIGTNPIVIRDYVQAAETLGYNYLLALDHILGMDPTNRPGWRSVFNHQSMIHEPFVLFGYLAALTTMELGTAVLVLPQRQTALVAKQAAEVSILTGGKLRLGIGVGWNQFEYEFLGKDFHQRGRLVDEQIEVLRLLWNKEVVSYTGKFHTIIEAGINPLPVNRSIPIWIGGFTEAAIKRVARLGDGWISLNQPNERTRAMIERLHGYIREAGRDPKTVGIDACVNASSGDLDELVRQTNAWRELGATHITINTMNAGYTSPDQHIEAIRRYREAIAHSL